MATFQPVHPDKRNRLLSESGVRKSVRRTVRHTESETHTSTHYDFLHVDRGPTDYVDLFFNVRDVGVRTKAEKEWYL